MKQIVIVCGAFLALISGTNAGKWYETDEGNHYFIETERKAGYYDSMRECQNMNYSSYLVYMDNISNSDKRQIEILAKKLADIDNTDIWTAEYERKDPERCPSLWTTEDPKCNKQLGFICKGSPPQELITLITSNEMKLKNLLIEKLVELDEMEKSYKRQIDQVLKEKTNELNELMKSMEADKLALTRECDAKLEYLKKSPEIENEEILKGGIEELAVIKKNETIPNKYYNIIFRNG